jgi:L-amino acid N-acyltransferase YncA
MSRLSVRLAVPADAAALCTIYNQGIEDRIATLETELRTPEERRQWLLARGPRHPVIVAEADESAPPAHLGPGARVIERSESQARAGASLGARVIERSESQARAGASPGARVIERSESQARAGASPGARAMVVTGWASLNSFNPRHAYDGVADLSVYVERGWRGRGVGRCLLERLVEIAGEIGYHKLVLAAFPFNASGLALYERLGFSRVGVYREQGRLDGRWVDVLVMERLLEAPAARG